MDQYEATQGFSPTFSAFAESVAKRLVDKWGLEGKRVVEIGCGKGEFLRALCACGVGQAIGYDPTCDPERIPSNLADKTTIHRELFTHAHVPVNADCICCRHTLEHIPETKHFMTLVRQAAGPRTDLPVFFDVPDVLRILREGAFWDLYYEHCSYFSPGSLARLFRSVGFDVADLWLDYNDQYIMLTAVPAQGLDAPAPELEDDLDDLRNLAAKFPAHVGDVMARWRGFLEKHSRAGRRVILWGSTSKCVSFLTSLGVREEVDYVVDINPFKHGKYLPGTGHEIVAPSALPHRRPDVVVVMNPIYQQEVAAELEGLGIRAEVVPLR